MDDLLDRCQTVLLIVDEWANTHRLCPVCGRIGELGDRRHTDDCPLWPAIQALLARGRDHCGIPVTKR